jgi:hypothetical protein
MVARFGPFLVGPVVWLVVYGLMIAASVLLWGFSPDSYIGLAIAVYVSAGVAALAARGVMRKLSPAIRAKTVHLIVALFALLWCGSSAAVAPNGQELDYRLVSLAASQIGIFTWLRIAA